MLKRYCSKICLIRYKFLKSCKNLFPQFMCSDDSFKNFPLKKAKKRNPVYLIFVDYSTLII